jgi:5'(3')-deoxyribonucleotidase
VRRLTIGVDVDDTVADLCSAWVAEYNRRWDDTIKEWTTWDLPKIVKSECGTKVYEILQDPELYDRVLPISGALAGINHLRNQGHRVVYVTSCGYDPKTVSASSGAKLDWLRQKGFLAAGRESIEDFVIAADKTLAAVDVLVDDRATTIVKWTGLGKLGVLFDRPHNRGCTDGVRAKGWFDVNQIIDAAEMSAPVIEFLDEVVPMPLTRNAQGVLGRWPNG